MVGVVLIQDLLTNWIANPGIVAIIALRSGMWAHTTDESKARLIFMLFTRGCILMLLTELGTSGKGFFIADWGCLFQVASSSTTATQCFPLSTRTS